MKSKTVFFCTECGNETPKWNGRCAACGSWNTIVEQPSYAKTPAPGAAPRPAGAKVGLHELSKLDATAEMRFKTGFGELDRVLGGGAVVGSLVLVGGSPGIGKSTLLMQMCGKIGCAGGRNESSLRSPSAPGKARTAEDGDDGRAGGRNESSEHREGSFVRKILYVSGEESGRQLKMRAERLGVKGEGVFVIAETEISEVLSAVEEISPDILIIDSIQTLYNPELSSTPGSVGQVKDCTASLLRLSKSGEITVFLIGHVNKDGAIAGPKVLEHMVDCVMYFEGERSMNYRILRAAKNRYGSTNEIGVFEMLDNGLNEVMNPSELLLAGRPAMTPGTCVTCVIEGSRPILAEVQALVTPSSANMPRRNANGIEYNRAMMLLAVLQQRGGLRVAGCDAYINVIGGLSIEDPGADLATVLALASSYMDAPIRFDAAVFGEVGLTGELRQVSQVAPRLSEISRLGFTACILPYGLKGRLPVQKGLELIHVKSVNEAITKAIEK